MSNADKMLHDLGFTEYSEWNYCPTYTRKVYTGYELQIRFYEETVHTTIIIDGESQYGGIALYPKLLNAIHAKMQELGWCDETNKA